MKEYFPTKLSDCRERGEGQVPDGSICLSSVILTSAELADGRNPEEDLFVK